MIVATAKAAGAAAFYTDDPKCQRLAMLAGMHGRGLPVKHPDIYRDAELADKLGLPRLLPIRPCRTGRRTTACPSAHESR